MSGDQPPVSRDEFLSRALHDLKAPARHVVNFTGMLRDSLSELPVDESSLRFLDTIERSGANMQQLLQSLGDYLRMPSTAGPVAQVDVGELVQYCWADLSGLGPNEIPQITIHGTATIHSDSRLLSMALTQTLHNSLRFCKPNTTLTVQCTVTTNDETCSIEIQDNGTGIDPGFIARAAEPFSRLPKPDVKCGSGLGLALCQRAVDLLDGTLQLASDGDSGTTVTIELPRTLALGRVDQAAENDSQTP